MSQIAERVTALTHNAQVGQLAGRLTEPHAALAGASATAAYAAEM
jgi:hypothetical protein